MRRWLIFFGTLIIFLLSSFPFFSFTPLSKASEPQLQIIEGSIKETFSQSLHKKKIPLQWIDLIVLKLEPFVNFKNIQGGSYQFIADEKGEMVKFIYEAGPTEIYEIEKDPEGEFVVKRREVPLETYLVKVEGEIRSSLARAIKAAGEWSSLATDIAEVLAWEIDFSKDVRRGDRFKVVVEKIYKGDQFIKYGTIHAVEYQSGKKTIMGVRFKNRYYDEKGHSLAKAFLKTPLRFSYISSGFNRKRRHPIMGGIEPHLGVDYAAAIGTPVWAVADGIVVFCGWVEGFGKQVILRHPNGYMSYYSHLSRYGPGIKERKRVEQKQIIGYVGSTGFSTGLHLDYRLSKNGHFINPLTKIFPIGKPVGQKEMEAFRERRDEVMAWLNEELPFRRRLEEGRGTTIKRN